MAAVLKTVERKFRGFESLPLRHSETLTVRGQSLGISRRAPTGPWALGNAREPAPTHHSMTS
jgi:hypothetical protein